MCSSDLIVITDPAQAVPMAHALLEGGIDVMEITLRHAAGLPAIEAVARQVPQMHVGAGTVTRAHEMALVQAAGASFALSPGMSAALVTSPAGHILIDGGLPESAQRIAASVRLALNNPRAVMLEPLALKNLRSKDHDYALSTLVHEFAHAPWPLAILALCFFGLFNQLPFPLWAWASAKAWR